MGWNRVTLSRRTISFGDSRKTAATAVTSPSRKNKNGALKLRTTIVQQRQNHKSQFTHVTPPAADPCDRQNECGLRAPEGCGTKPENAISAIDCAKTNRFFGKSSGFRKYFLALFRNSRRSSVNRRSFRFVRNLFDNAPGLGRITPILVEFFSNRVRVRTQLLLGRHSAAVSEDFYVVVQSYITR